MESLEVFERIEKKYLMDRAQYSALQERLQGRILPDRYGLHTICNIYFDTPDWRLIRASLDRPVYKEKLRLRSYGVPDANGEVYAELKKKFKRVVYKRRTPLSLREAEDWLYRDIPALSSGQVAREIDWFRALYAPLLPRVFIGYDREAFVGAQDNSLRLTFDKNIRYRTNRLTLSAGADGTPVLPKHQVLMEIKVPGAFPLWLSRELSALQIYPHRYSKYGACYQQFIFPALDTKGGLQSA